MRIKITKCIKFKVVLINSTQKKKKNLLIVKQSCLSRKLPYLHVFKTLSCNIYKFFKEYVLILNLLVTKVSE